MKRGKMGTLVVGTAKERDQMQKKKSEKKSTRENTVCQQMICKGELGCQIQIMLLQLR